MIPLMKNTFINEYETKVELANFILRTSKLSMGEECRQFEIEFGSYQDRKNSVLFNSGGSANLALLQAMKNLGRLRPGDKVGFSALTWSTNVMPIIQMGLIPIPIDCNVTTLNVMSENIRVSLLRHNLKALFVTNALGWVGDYDNIVSLCDDQEILLLEDNCESLGTIYQGKKTGNFGLASSFSFFVAHHMSTIEGGMICTDDFELSDMLRLVRANGWDRNLNVSSQQIFRKKFSVKSEFEAKYTFYDLAFNLRPTEITGFLGRAQLKYLEENIIKRLENFNYVNHYTMMNDDFIPLDFTHIQRLSTFAMPFVCKSQKHRSRYLERFSGAGIEVRPMIAGNITKQPFYSKYCNPGNDLKDTDTLDTCGFYCGNYPELSRADLDTIAGCLMK